MEYIASDSGLIAKEFKVQIETYDFEWHWKGYAKNVSQAIKEADLAWIEFKVAQGIAERHG